MRRFVQPLLYVSPPCYAKVPFVAVVVLEMPLPVFVFDSRAMPAPIRSLKRNKAGSCSRRLEHNIGGKVVISFHPRLFQFIAFKVLVQKGTWPVAHFTH